MEFAFTEEQQMIRDTADAFLADVSGSDAVRAAMATERGYDPELWQRICSDMYWQAITIPEAQGGMGLGYVELVAVIEQMGRYLLCAPFFSTVCMAVNALLLAGNDEQKNDYLGRVLEGATATLAFTDQQGLWTAEGVQARYRCDGDDFVLDGSYRFVIDGHSADILILAAREEGSSAEQGISLFVLNAEHEGLLRSWLPSMDQTRRQAEIQVHNLRLPRSALLGEQRQGWPVLEKTLQLASIALAAEQMGGAQQVLDLTVAYTKERVQFGRPVAGFQGVKHQAADMMLNTEVSRSAVYYAACVADEALQGGSLGAELPEAASVAKAWCSDAYFHNAGAAIQLHGGVGFTWEYDVHLYFKRARSSRLLLGDAAFHREQVARIILDQENSACS